MNHGWLLGFALGIVTSSPIGPTGLLCLRRTFIRGAKTGLISALGISCAYAFWAYVAIHGLATISHWIQEEKLILQFTIGVFFLLYGVNEIFNKPKTNYPGLRRKGGSAEFLSTFLVVFLNPATFIMFSVLFALLGLARSVSDPVQCLGMAMSVFAGSMIFWCLIIFRVHMVRGNIQESVYNTILRLSSYAIVIFALVILLLSMHNYLIHGR